MSLPTHPLLALIDAHKNGLKAKLTNYIDFTVENQFGQLRNQIGAMIESGVLGYVPLVSTQPNDHLSTDQIVPPPALLANQITTKPVIKKECLDTSSSTITPINLDCNDVKEEYNDDDDFEDEGEYMSDCDECEDCLNGICSQSAQLVNNQQSIASTSSKRKITTESSEAVLKKVKIPENVVQIHHQEGTETKSPFVTFELNCTEPGCEMIFTNYQQWKEHLYTCHGQIAYAHLEDRARLNQHGQTEYPCSECDSVVKSHLSLITHWRLYHQAGKFQCSLCTFGANLMFEVLNHRRREHLSKQFQCTHVGCDRAFKSKQHLQEHQQSHSNEKPFVCIWDSCDVSFKHLKHAVRHVRTQHFNLPPNQNELNIIDQLDPKLYVRLN